MSRKDLDDYLVDELKIDKDCFINKAWIKEYVKWIIRICKSHGIGILDIRMCLSKMKGLHFYIRISPAIDPVLANMLQFLLGDDSRRVAFNKARIDSGLQEWNKLFEKPGIKLRTIYQDEGFEANAKNSTS